MIFRHTSTSPGATAPARRTVAPGRVRRVVALAGVVAALGLAVVACGEPDPPPPVVPVTEPTTTTTVPVTCGAPAGSDAAHVAVMGPCPRLTADQIAFWFGLNTKVPYNATVPIAELVRLFLDEGRAEGVRGDLAFAQSIVESGWFSFPGRVPASANNFSGFGATDNTADYGVFPDARTGVRAQIQHLRRYADASATACWVPPLHNPCVDPRFAYVTPAGKAPTWNQFGGGNWATDPTYASKVLGVYTSMLGIASLSLA